MGQVWLPDKIEFKCEGCVVAEAGIPAIEAISITITIHIKDMSDIVEAIYDGWPICKVCGIEMVEC